MNTAASAMCRFPADWRGKYYQGGYGEIIIRDSHITSKGVCIEQSKDYYLLENKWVWWCVAVAEGDDVLAWCFDYVFMIVCVIVCCDRGVFLFVWYAGVVVLCGICIVFLCLVVGC